MRKLLVLLFMMIALSIFAGAQNYPGGPTPPSGPAPPYMPPSPPPSSNCAQPTINTDVDWSEQTLIDNNSNVSVQKFDTAPATYTITSPNGGPLQGIKSIEVDPIKHPAAPYVLGQDYNITVLNNNYECMAMGIQVDIYNSDVLTIRVLFDNGEESWYMVYAGFFLHQSEEDYYTQCRQLVEWVDLSYPVGYTKGQFFTGDSSSGAAAFDVSLGAQEVDDINQVFQAVRTNWISGGRKKTPLSIWISDHGNRGRQKVGKQGSIGVDWGQGFYVTNSDGEMPFSAYFKLGVPSPWWDVSGDYPVISSITFLGCCVGADIFNTVINKTVDLPNQLSLAMRNLAVEVYANTQEIGDSHDKNGKPYKAGDRYGQWIHYP